MVAVVDSILGHRHCHARYWGVWNLKWVESAMSYLSSTILCLQNSMHKECRVQLANAWWRELSSTTWSMYFHLSFSFLFFTFIFSVSSCSCLFFVYAFGFQLTGRVDVFTVQGTTLISHFTDFLSKLHFVFIWDCTSIFDTSTCPLFGGLSYSRKEKKNLRNLVYTCT